MTDPTQTQLVEPQKQLSKPRRKHVLNPVNRGVPWSDVLRGVPRSETRSQVLDHYRRLGGQTADWGTLDNYDRMARAMTAAEDWMENEHQQWTRDRLALREVTRGETEAGGAVTKRLPRFRAGGSLEIF